MKRTGAERELDERLKKWDGFTIEQKKSIIENGLAETFGAAGNSQEIIVVGAGMAGLVAARELARVGNRVTILEARHRVGGRVWTLREPFADKLYAEAGAMRIPREHALTRAYITELGLEKKLKPFKQSCDNAFYYFHSHQRHGEERLTYGHYKERPGDFGFDIPERDDEMRREGDTGFDKSTARARTALELWNFVLERIKEEFSNGKGEVDWDAVSKVYDHISTLLFLERGGRTWPLSGNSGKEKKEQRQIFPRWSLEEIHMFGLVENQHARLNNSVLALLREYLVSLKEDSGFDYIQGGMDQLPRALYMKNFKGRRKNLKDCLMFGAKVEGVFLPGTEDSGGTESQRRRPVGVEYRDATQTKNKSGADRLVFAIPFTMMRHLRGLEIFGNQKQLAIQALNYSAAGKIFLQCKRRFWESLGIRGGRSQTDLAIRSVWYPEHGEGGVHFEKPSNRGRGVLLASYTWGRDAERWGHLTPEDRIRRASERIYELHTELDPKVEHVIETGTSVMWQNEEFSGGAFALFNPQQEVIHCNAIRRPEGPDGRSPVIHFAGEHTCPEYHRWVEGAVDSGLRVAWEVHTGLK